MGLVTKLGFLAGWSLLIAGCSADSAPRNSATQATESVPDGASAPVSPGQPPAPEATAPAMPQGQGADADNAIDLATDTYEFQYSYPAAAAAIAPLREELDRRRDAMRAEVETRSRAEKSAAAQGAYPFRPQTFSASWSVVADVPDWLSLFAETYEFTGGAHGMSGFEALVWNRRIERLERPLDLFVSAEAFSAALRTRLCRALDAQRAQRRGQPLEPGAPFTDCIDPARQTVLLGSSNGKTFDRLEFRIAPYEAGPYAEGSYDVTLGVDGAVMRALRPQYRNAFSIFS
ncbi:DUF3298 and DUF4163 domain-containing protein [Novosphingobium sp. 1949]|uniref:DUF3298 and DUF4163 domain-containing protein n=1 Tax=Novosphingobium organovorum TaxID=2930092 RepID=A0ABT0BHK9_9SPHN|nr:DUF4163 domain-containing protein [Novosphingobium organovorum]MCJ2184556.1 DUF3298 and DUF4163 domain-containing protein [Novosphingobium organovorum]